MRKLYGILPLLVFLTSWTPLAAQGDLTPLLKAQTVMISIAREGGGTEIGSGIVLCQDESQAYILTARHVVFGKTPGNTAEPDAGAISSIEIRWFQNLSQPIVENRQDKVITKQSAGKGRDLLLLTVPLPVVLPATAVLSAGAAGPGAGDESGPVEPAIYSVGSQQRAGERPESWALTQGVLLRQEQETLYHTAPVTSGFSGGPLFNGSGALIGINVDQVPGLLIGGDPKVIYGRALAVGPVIETVNKWLPGICLRSSGPVRELAHETYRRAMKAVSIKDWPKAEALMRQALEHLAQEGGIVHLQGMRYTTYLPRYHLALSLYKQNHCGEALREWGRSEVQSAIQDDRRYRKMKKLQKKCGEALRRAIQKAAVSTER